MLTALDFPDELLYAPHAFWVRDDGAGSVRIGVNAYALSGARDEVIHVRLPRPEARLRRGEVFGHIDLEGGTLDLVAPVSGEVLATNRDLRADPDLLRRDPYGRGYLLDVEYVPEAEIAALWDRETAFRHYRAFEPPGLFYAEARLEAGRPWASSFALRMGDFVVARASLVPARANEAFVPDWEPGDRWQVEFRAGGSARRFAYEVEGEERLGGDEVVRVRMVEVREGGEAPAEAARVLYFRRDDFTLAAWDLVPLRNPRLARRTRNPRGREAWVRTDPEDGVILDHPRLPVGSSDESREIDPGAEGPGTAALVAYAKFRGGGTRLETELRAEIPAGKLVSTQVWEAGAPFWVEAARTIDGKEAIAARLVSQRV
jgi:glycine cleavage system H protein